MKRSKVKVVAKPNALFHQGKPINGLPWKTIQFGLRQCSCARVDWQRIGLIKTK